MRNDIFSGDKLMVFINNDNDWQTIAYATSHQLTISVSTKRVSSREHTIFGSVDATEAEWTISAEHLMTEESYSMLHEFLVNRTVLTLVFGVPDSFNGSGYRGKAIITSLRTTANNGDISTYNATFLGVSAISKTDESPSYAPSTPSRANASVFFAESAVSSPYAETNVYQMPALTNNARLPIRYVVENVSGRVVEDEGITYLVTTETGDINVTAIFDGDDDYNYASDTMTFSIGHHVEDDSWTPQDIVPSEEEDDTKMDAILWFERETVDIEQNEYGLYDIEDLYNPYNLPVTLTCDNQAVTIDQLNWQIRVSEIGTYHIVAVFEGNESFNGSTAGYDLTIAEASEDPPLRDDVTWNINTSSQISSSAWNESYSGTIRPISIAPPELASLVKVYLGNTLLESDTYTLTVSGTYTIRYVFEGNDYYNQSSTFYQVSYTREAQPEPQKENVAWSIDTTFMSVSTYTDETYIGEIRQISITPSSLAPEVKVYLDNTLLDSDTYTLTVSGTYTIRYVFEGNEDYNPSSTSYQIVYTQEARPEPPIDSTQYLTFEAIEDATFTLNDVDDSHPSAANALKYSRNNGETWNDYNSLGVYVSAGNKVLWKAETYYSSDLWIGTFSSTGRFKVYGNILSLIGGDNLKSGMASQRFTRLFFNNDKLVDASNLVLPHDLVARGYNGERLYQAMFYGCTSLINAPSVIPSIYGDYCCISMFMGCTSLVTAPELPATTLTDRCYALMFQGCTSLVNAPELPATSLVDWCYEEMFGGCTSLVNAPELPATTLTNWCYASMFVGCTSLVNAPELPATTLASYCYDNMFSGCTSLMTAPELPATTLADWCYDFMFSGCTSLVTAPELPATTLASYCYYNMFQGCTSLMTAPELPATSLVNHCYQRMFVHCTSLVTAPELPATSLADYCYVEMFEVCTSLVTAPELPATTLVNHCYAYMFYGCTSLVTAPELPATSLAYRCYANMFEGCTSLVNAPELPATTLVSDCYGSMFEGCTSLNYVKALFTTKPVSQYTYKWLASVSQNGTFVKNANATWDSTIERGQNTVPAGWTIISE